MVVEAFPAAQLRQWNLPHTRYNGADPQAIAARQAILVGLITRGLCVNEAQVASCISSADALDAIVCLFSSLAFVTSQSLPVTDNVLVQVEGHIVVHV